MYGPKIYWTTTQRDPYLHSGAHAREYHRICGRLAGGISYPLELLLLYLFSAKAAEAQANSSAEVPRSRSLPRSRRVSWSRDWLASSETQSGGRGPSSHNHSLALSPANLVWAASAGQRQLLVLYCLWLLLLLLTTLTPMAKTSAATPPFGALRRSQRMIPATPDGCRQGLCSSERATIEEGRLPRGPPL